MPRLQSAAAGALITFCHPERMQGEWLYEPAAGGGEAVGLVMLRSLAALVPASGSPCVVVREEALTAAGIISQVRCKQMVRGGGESLCGVCVYVFSIGGCYCRCWW